ncbi:MAG: hypothetical protein ACTHNM_11790 [Dyella sp.]|uniref:hypothetical protein n=1 Tax=Dyella sp. TaxID=1869338 RepID=UPI003F809186
MAEHASATTPAPAAAQAAHIAQGIAAVAAERAPAPAVAACFKGVVVPVMVVSVMGEEAFAPHREALAAIVAAVVVVPGVPATEEALMESHDVSPIYRD